VRVLEKKKVCWLMKSLYNYMNNCYSKILPIILDLGLSKLSKSSIIIFSTYKNGIPIILEIIDNFTVLVEPPQPRKYVIYSLETDFKLW